MAKLAVLGISGESGYWLVDFENGTVSASIESLESMAAEIDRAYGQAWDRECVMALTRNEGSLAEVMAFARSAAGDE